MLRTSKVTISVVAMLTMCCVIGMADAQQEREGQAKVSGNKGNVTVDVDAKGGTDRKVSRRDKASYGIAHRVSEIQGMTVQDDSGKDLGTVKDVVIDVRAGQVKYAALSYGGFLGLGDKLFAVPWDAFEHRHNTSDDECKLVLSIDEATLKNAPGFDESQWPNFADGKVADELKKHYGQVDRRSGVDVDRDRTRSTSNEKDVVHRASDIIGMTVRNTAEKDLGMVNDLVIATESGKIRYAALSYGGIAGIGDKLFAVPWKSLECQYNPSDEEYHLVLAIDEATLRKAPGFDQDKWPNLADPKFGASIDGYYGGTDKDPAKRKASRKAGRATTTNDTSSDRDS